MDLSDFQRKAVLLIFISIVAGSILLARKEPLNKQVEEKAIIEKSPVTQIQETSIPTKIDINTADMAMVMQLPGIGPVLARDIINYRAQKGPFSTIDDLLNVPGIGEKRLARIKYMIDLAEETPTSTKIDLNKATTKQISTIPGVGPKLAQAIIDYRQRHGRFKSLEELMYIPRIGQKTYDKLTEYLYLEKMSEATPRTSRPRTSHQIDLKAKCPHCRKQLWEKGKRKKIHVRCPHCLKLLKN